MSIAKAERSWGRFVYTHAMHDPSVHARHAAQPSRALRFDRLEWAGAFGDLGTLIPFVVAYISVANVDPLGMVFTFGVCMLASGLYYRTPFPVQPMKAIGAAAATQTQLGISAATLSAAGLITGVIWLVLGLSGAARRAGRLLDRPVAVGIVLGLGIGFMLEGTRLMATTWLLSAVALLTALLLIQSRRFPVMFLLLAGGVSYQLAFTPDLLDQLSVMQPHFQVPTLAWTQIGWNDLWVAAIVLSLPQVPLTLGNAVIAITEENNRLFPDHKVDEKKVSVSTGLMNLFSSVLGGVPMCHGAGGMAGHVRFGARTGGAPVILGVLLILLALFFSGSIAALLAIFPHAILGVILFLTGAQLALGSCDFGKSKDDRFASIVTAALAIYNVGIAFIAGMAVCWLLKRELIKL